MPPITIDEQIACVQRERDMRMRLYPRWVRDGKLTQAAADEELCRLDAVLATLEAVRVGQDAKVPDAVDIRRGERALVMGTLLPMIPSGVMMRLERKLRPLMP